MKYSLKNSFLVTKIYFMKRKILRNARGINNVPIAHGALVYVRMINASQKETCRNS